MSENSLINTPEVVNTIRVHSMETFGTHDGPGIRLVVFVQGCQFRCLYCQNPDTLDLKGGTEYKIEELVKKALRQKDFFGHNGGVTVSGGEPLLQRHALVPFFKELHYHGIHTCLDSNGRVLDTDAKTLLAETDLLLLDILSAKNQLGSNIFSSMFKKGNSTVIFKFLDEETSFSEDLQVIWKCPKMLFVKALLLRIFK